jgi:hypothetical protein
MPLSWFSGIRHLFGPVDVVLDGADVVEVVRHACTRRT